MNNQRDHLPLLTVPSSRFAPGPMMAALVALTALVWFVADSFNVDDAGMLATAMVVVVLGLMTVAMCSALASRATAQAPAQSITGVVEGGIYPVKTGHVYASSHEDLFTPLTGKRWSLDVFAAIDAKRFAAVCETWFSWAGFDSHSESHRTDEGVDIWLHAAKMPGPVAIVRCKHWPNKPVGLQEMKDFLGVVAIYKSAHGTYTTTSTYTPEALQFANEHGIDAVDGRGLLRRIQTRTRQSQQALLAVAYSGLA